MLKSESPLTCESSLTWCEKLGALAADPDLALIAGPSSALCPRCKLWVPKERARLASHRHSGGECVASGALVPAFAAVKIIYELKEQASLVRCVEAMCNDSGDRTGEPVRGTGEASIRAALQSLNQTCSCGARFHQEE